MISTGALYAGPGETGYSSKEGTTPQDGNTISDEVMQQKTDDREDLGGNVQQSHDFDWVNKFVLLIHKTQFTH